jgi:hypothetical protein
MHYQTKQLLIPPFQIDTTKESSNGQLVMTKGEMGSKSRGQRSFSSTKE